MGKKRKYSKIFSGILCFIFLFTSVLPVSAAPASSDSTNGANLIEVEYNFTPPALSSQGGFTSISMQGTTSTMEPCKPIVPVKTAKILIPEEKQVDKIVAQGLGKTQVATNIKLKYGEYLTPLLPDGVEYKTAAVAEPDAEIYNSTNKFPPELYKNTYPLQNIFGYGVLFVDVFPVEYIPKDGKVSYYNKIKLSIYLKDKGNNVESSNTIKVKAYYQADKANYIKDLVDNDGTFDSIKSKISSLSSASSDKIPASYTTPKGITVNGNYIIITNSSLKSAFEGLLNTKREQGYEGCVVLIDDIISKYSGKDTQEKIRNFIIEVYNGQGKVFFVLGGDSSVIPLRVFAINDEFFIYNDDPNNYEDYRDNLPADCYYSNLDGNWDANGNGIYGEESETDFTSEVIVGRIPARSGQEIQTYIAKLKKYYQDMLNEDTSLKNMVFYGGNYPPNLAEDSKAAEDVIPAGNSYNITPMYDSSSKQYTLEELMVKMNSEEGTHLYLTNQHSNHSSDGLISSEDLSQFVNKHLPIVLSSGCYPGTLDGRSFVGQYNGEWCSYESVPWSDRNKIQFYYDSDYFGRTFLVKSETGFIIHIANSRYGWCGVSGKQLNQIMKNMYNKDTSLNKYYSTIGEAFIEGKMDYAVDPNNPYSIYLNWVYYITNLSGDPALPTLNNVKPVKASIQSQVVTLTSGTAGAKIYYTIDGSIPTASSNLYSKPITISGSATIKAIAIYGKDKSIMSTFTVADTAPPAVSSTLPLNNAAGVKKDSQIVITFNEALQAGNTKIDINGVNNTGIVNGSTVTVAAALEYSKTYTVNVPAGAVKDTAGNANAVYSFSFTTEAAPDTTPPAVVSTVPANNATGTSINSQIVINFNEALQAGTGAATLNGKSITGTLKDNSLTFNPAFYYDTKFDVVLSAGAVKDIAGNANAAYSFSFTTEKAPDVPVVTNTEPSNGAFDAKKNGQIKVVFSKTLQAGNAAVDIDGVNITGTANGNTLTIVPAFEYSKTYKVNIPAGVVKDEAGNGNIAFSFSFTTEKDLTPPVVSTTIPQNNAVDVKRESQVVITFSKALQAGNAKIAINGGEIAGTVSGNTLTISPILEFEKAYAVSIPAGAVKDVVGNANTVYSFNFTTEKAPEVPIAINTIPLNNATDVKKDSQIVITYSEELQAGNAKIDINGVSTTGAVSGNTITVAAALEYSKTYTVNVAAGAVKDLDGNGSLACSFSFKTEKEPDLIPPRVSSTVPSNNASGVSKDTKIVVKFSEALQAGNTTVKINNIDAQAIVNENTVLVQTTLDFGNTYNVIVPAGSVKDLAGNANVEYSFSFKTETEKDSIIPEVSSTVPENNAVDVKKGTQIAITYSEQLKAGTGKVIVNGKKVSGTVKGNVLKISTALKYNTQYIITIPAGTVKDTSGNANAEFTLVFQTELLVDTTPPVISLDPKSGKVKSGKSIEISVQDDSGLSEIGYAWAGDSAAVVSNSLDTIPVPVVTQDTTRVLNVYATDSSANKNTTGWKSYTFEITLQDSQEFEDVPASHWAYKEITDMAAKGIIKGYSDGTFRPDNPVTRAEFAKIMVLSLNLPLTTSKSTFSDVSSSYWASNEIETAKKYLTGYNASSGLKFKPEENAVREDVAVALVRAKGYNNDFIDASDIYSQFSDANLISKELRKYVLIAKQRGLISGNPDGTFKPGATLTRAEAAKLLWQIAQ
ncbi:MAG: Ig-like domain-containing protein [Ignavibacteriales bacterium]